MKPYPICSRVKWDNRKCNRDICQEVCYTKQKIEENTACMGL